MLSKLALITKEEVNSSAKENNAFSGINLRGNFNMSTRREYIESYSGQFQELFLFSQH